MNTSQMVRGTSVVRALTSLFLRYISSLGLIIGSSHYANAQQLFGINEIAVPSLPDIAIASFDSSGARVIYFNPQITAAVGSAVTAFFRAHEYAHHILGDVEAINSAQHPYTKIDTARSAEIKADRWATEYWMRNDPSVVYAFIQFMGASSTYGDLTHLPSATRAALVLQHARQIGSGGGGSGQKQIVVPCVHPAHDQGDLVPCPHGPIHPRGDIIQCQHPVMTPYGLMPAHGQGDLVACQHVAHPAGDIVPCQHPAHTQGDIKSVP